MLTGFFKVNSKDNKTNRLPKITKEEKFTQRKEDKTLVGGLDAEPEQSTEQPTEKRELIEGNNSQSEGTLTKNSGVVEVISNDVSSHERVNEPLNVTTLESPSENDLKSEFRINV
jgi:hypothetical protein